MTKNDAVERADPLTALDTILHIYEEQIKAFDGELPEDEDAFILDSAVKTVKQALQTSRPAPDEQAALDFLIEYSNKNEGWQDDHRAEHDAAIETIRAALKAGDKGRWMPIESAPRDGRRIIVRGSYPVASVGFWEAPKDRWNVFQANWVPTHWQFLPPTSEGV